MKDRNLDLLEDVRDRLETIQSIEEKVEEIRRKYPTLHSDTPSDVVKRLREKKYIELRYYFPDFRALLLRVQSDLREIVLTLPSGHELRDKFIRSFETDKTLIDMEEGEIPKTPDFVIDGLICVGNEFKKLENDLRVYIDEE